jgi:lysophospholipase L1-like esterase
MRYLIRVAALVAAVGFLAAGGAYAGPNKTGYPNSIASAGNSITRAFNTDGFFKDAPANSWSTGDNDAVTSHYLRILAAAPAIEGRRYNDAVTGAKMGDLLAQVERANSQNVAYITILIGSNDVCTRSETSMTPVATFRQQFEAAMRTLSSESPRVRIFVASIPNIYRLWRIFKDNLLARTTWNLFDICQSLLDDPRSDDPEDVARRQRVRQRTFALNQQLLEVCELYIHCRFDGGAVHSFLFMTEDVSKRDYFHPSREGQRELAAITWTATFDFTDQIAPTSNATVSPSDKGNEVSLQATDNVGVSGIEFRLDGGPWQRYTSTLFLPAGSELRFRAVDVNGNTEETHVLAP